MAIWRKLKAIVARLLAWLRHRRSGETQPQAEPNRDYPRQTRPASKRIRLPNMPKYQPCPNRHGSKKRTEKTLGGAHYYCNKCGDFFVRGYG